MRGLRSVLILFIIIVSGVACEREKIIEDESGIIKTQLNNGLRILIKESHSSPIVTIQFKVLVGSLDEPDSHIGISNLIRHMYLKGTEKRPLSLEMSSEAKSYGASFHSSIGYQDTTYSMTLPSRYFEQALELQLDALINPKFDPTELSKETEVVIQEGKQMMDTPLFWINETLKKIIFQKHRLKRPSIGSEENLRRLTRQEIIDFYHSYYKANHMILTIIGDIQPRETLKAVRKYTKDLPTGDVLKNNSDPEPKQEEPRYKRVVSDIRNSYVAIGYATPPMGDKDSFALEMISHLLGTQKSSRLYKSLKSEKALVNRVQTKIENLKDIGFFTILVRLDAKNIYAAEMMTLTEIERLKQSPVSDQELKKIQGKIETDELLSLETTLGLAHKLSHYEQFDNYSWIRNYVHHLKAVTKEDIQRVAKEYLTLDRSSILEYISRDEVPHSYPAKNLFLKLRFQVKQMNSKLGKREDIPAFEATIDVPSKKDIKSLPMKRYQLSNDALVWLKETHDLPMIALSILFKGGRLYEERKNSGITQLLIRTSLNGTTTKTDRQIWEDFDLLGANIDFICEPDYFGYSLLLHQKHLNEGLKILSDIILNPSFSTPILTREKQYLLAELDYLEDEPEKFTYQLFREAALKNHPYGLPDLGLKDSISKISSDHLMQWHTRMINSTDMVMGVVGDFNTLDIRTSLENYFKRIKPRRDTLPDIEQTKFPSFISENFRKRYKEQTAILVGFEGAPISHPDYYALKLLEALSSGITGRFGHRLSVQEKLTHIVKSKYHADLKGGSFTTYTTVSPENEKETMRALLEEYKKLSDSEIEKQELIITKNYLLGLKLVMLESVSSQALDAAVSEILGIPLANPEEFNQKINTVTLSELNEVASKYFDLEKYTLGIVRGAQETKAFISTPPKPIVIPKPKRLPKPKTESKPVIPELLTPDKPFAPEKSAEPPQ